MHPLQLYPDEQDLDQARRVNFDPKLYAKLQKLAKHPDHGTPDEVQVFDYINGVLHCPAYRDTYSRTAPALLGPVVLGPWVHLDHVGKCHRRHHTSESGAAWKTGC